VMQARAAVLEAHARKSGQRTNEAWLSRQFEGLGKEGA